MAGVRPAGPGIGPHGHTLGWAGLAVGLGALVHVLTDCLTPEGCPVFWPAPARVELPLVPRTDGLVEKWALTPLLTLGVVILAMRSSAGASAAQWLTGNRG